MNEQIYEVLSGDFSMHHPPLHTFIIWCFVKIANNDYALAVSIYGICQMILLSIVFSSVILSLIKKECPLIILIISILFYSLNPVIAIFSFIPIKDMICSAFFTLFSLEIISLISSPDCYCHKFSNICRFVVFALLFCLFRNNAIYAFLLAFPIFYFSLKTIRRQTFLLFSAVLLFYFIITLIVYPGLGIKGVESAEALSVPLQQISNAIVYGETLAETDISTISQFLQYDLVPSTYNPRFADPIKDIYNGINGPLFLIKEWLMLFPSHLKEYLNGFLSLHIPYWYPSANACDPFSHVAYIETNVSLHTTDAPFFNSGLFPQLLKRYETIATYSAFKALPQFFNIFSLSFYFWVLQFSLFNLLSRKNRLLLLVIIIPILFHLSYLLGPVSNLRYIMPIIVQFPIFLFINYASET